MKKIRACLKWRSFPEFRNKERELYMNCASMGALYLDLDTNDMVFVRKGQSAPGRQKIIWNEIILWFQSRSACGDTTATRLLIEFANRKITYHGYPRRKNFHHCFTLKANFPLTEEAA